MATILTLLAKVGMTLLASLPIERILALLLNKLLAKVEAGAGLDKALTTAKHITELSDLFSMILADKQIDEGEIEQLKGRLLTERQTLLALWADGKSTKGLQSELAKAGDSGTYAAPLSK